MSPRRSSRARTSQPASTAPPGNNSSTSSVSSGRADLTAHSNRKVSRSQSSEDLDGSAKLQARVTRSSQDNAKEQVATTLEDDNDDEVEEEVTRCICGNQEYPGLPVSASETAKGNPKEDLNPTAFAEDATGWFIQCDTCKVWQHGGCVGIMDETTSPEEYFCEQCRKDLHKITVTANGRKYSHYLPVEDTKSQQSSPAPAGQDAPKKSSDSRASRINAENVAKGRRSTMNSRDAAYDETEQLRRAIEESKKMPETASTATGVRKGKRSRSESEEINEDTKRQRTTSGSLSSASHSKTPRQDKNSEDEEPEKMESFKSIRGTAARIHRNKEVRDRESEHERERADITGRRKGRGERYGGDESDPSPEPTSRNASTKANASHIPFAPPPPPLPDHPPTKTSHKKTGRPPARRGRVGRNQYTKDRDLPTQTDLHSTNISPVRSNNSYGAEHGMQHLNGNTTTNGNGYADNNGLGKPSKPRHMNPNRTTMNDMKRRVAGILEFISHTQVEMAGAKPASTTKLSTSISSPPDSNTNTQNGGEQNGKDEHDFERTTNAELLDSDRFDERKFGTLSSIEMMEVLNRRLMKWQGEYGKWGVK